MLDATVRDVAQRIGLFYLQKNNGDYVKTEKDLTDLRIAKIEVNEKGVIVTTARPGLLIGKRGTNIDALAKHLKSEVRIIEDMDSIYDSLVPHKYTMV